MYSSVDTIWVLLGAALVFFMQAGFAMVETGLTRAKNAGNIIMKNLMDFALGTVAFWLAGFGIMFARGRRVDRRVRPVHPGRLQPARSRPGRSSFFKRCSAPRRPPSSPARWRSAPSSLAYCIYSVAISLIVYPVGGHWIWGGGWLSQLGFHDFAGSTAVHMVGGLCGAHRRKDAGAAHRQI